MRIIENNPFRILGIISNSSARETNEAETYILRYLDIGKSANLKFDISPPLKQLDRTNEIVKDAKRKIHDNFDKLSYSIFWFINGSLADKIALEKLSLEKDLTKASDSFKKGSRNFVISKNSFCSIINYSTLDILNYKSHKDDERVKNAIKYKFQIINDKSIFNEFEELITSTSNKINHKSFIDHFVKNIKNLLTDIYPNKDQNQLLLEIFSEDKVVCEDITSQMVSSLVEDINKKISLFGTLIKNESLKPDAEIVKSRSKIIKEAKKLVSETKTNLVKLKKNIGQENYEFSNLINEVYSYVNLSVILCYNKEMDQLNRKIETYNQLQIGTGVTYPSFKLYIDVLEEAAKAISKINCPIKETINNNLIAIRKNHFEGQRRNREQSSYQYSGGSSYSGSSSYTGSSVAGGCLEEIFVRLIGIALVVAIFSFFGWICG